MELELTEMDCEQIREITVISRKNDMEQKVYVNKNGVFLFFGENDRKNISTVIRLPFIKVWVFCTMICDMLNGQCSEMDNNVTWQVTAIDYYGNHYRAEGVSQCCVKNPKYDPSRYLREATGLTKMWLLDGLEIGQGRKEA